MHYLDNLRWFCMLFGIFVHAATVSDFGIWEMAPTLSAYFRMATFFAVSGYFAGLLLQKRSFPLFLRRRAEALLIPFFAALLLLNPLALWLVFRVHNPNAGRGIEEVISALGEPDRGPMAWHLHLWFLVSLFVYALVAPGFNRLIRARLGLLEEWISRVPDGLTGIAVGVSLAVAVVGMRAVNEAVNWWDEWLIQGTLSYFPYFLLGLAGFHLHRLWDRLHRIDWILIAIAAIGLGVDAWLLEGASGYVAESIRVGSKAMMTTAALCALLWAFRRFFDGTNAVASLLSDSIYTVYLFHYLVIYAWAWILIPNGVSGTALYWAVVTLTLPCCLAISVLVSRSNALRLLFNGRFPAR